MAHRWDNLTFLHWPVEPTLVQSLLPAGLEVETFDGSAWVGLVPFEMVVSLPQGGAVPWLCNFPETNVRTYVRGPDGETGVWFLSLEASRLAAVITARVTYRLPYFWSRMSVRRTGTVVTYQSTRRWPGPRGASCGVTVEVGERYEAGELTQFDHWLTARYRLYSAGRSGLGFALAEHDPWVLHRALALHVDTSLIAVAGLPRPTGTPIIHWSPGVVVRVSFPQHLP